eukprot:COSAG01_NODE_5020_length_4540_cov_25.225400_3_plen_212_part_00
MGGPVGDQLHLELRLARVVLEGIQDQLAALGGGAPARLRVPEPLLVVPDTASTTSPSQLAGILLHSHRDFCSLLRRFSRAPQSTNLCFEARTRAAAAAAADFCGGMLNQFPRRIPVGYSGCLRGSSYPCSDPYGGTSCSSSAHQLCASFKAVAACACSSGQSGTPFSPPTLPSAFRKIPCGHARPSRHSQHPRRRRRRYLRHRHHKVVAST